MSSEAITQTHQAAEIIPAAPWRLRTLSALLFAHKRWQRLQRLFLREWGVSGWQG